MDIKDINKLLATVSEADISELTLETGDYKLVVKRGQETVVVQAPVQPQIIQQLSPELIQQPQQVAQLPTNAPVPVEQVVQSEAPVEPEKSGVVLTEVIAPIPLA